MSLSTYAGYAPRSRRQVSPTDTRPRSLLAAALVTAKEAEATAHEHAEQDLAKTADALSKAFALQAAAQLAHSTAANRVAMRNLDCRNTIVDLETNLRAGAAPKLGEFLSVLAGWQARGYNMSADEAERVAAVRHEVAGAQLEADPDVDGLLTWGWSMLPPTVADQMRFLIQLALVPAA